MKSLHHYLSHLPRTAWILSLALLAGCPSNSDDHSGHEHDGHGHEAGEHSDAHSGDEDAEGHEGHDHDEGDSK
jgi:hypothetical protein